MFQFSKNAPLSSKLIYCNCIQNVVNYTAVTVSVLLVKEVLFVNAKYSKHLSVSVVEIKWHGSALDMITCLTAICTARPSS
jgi:hypothetical protein